MLGPVLVAMTVFQIAAGITFTPAEVAGPVVSFTLIGLIGMAMAALLLRDVDDRRVEAAAA